MWRARGQTPRLRLLLKSREYCFDPRIRDSYVAIFGESEHKTKRASLGAPKHRGAAKCGGPHPDRYSSVDLDCRLIYRQTGLQSAGQHKKGGHGDSFIYSSQFYRKPAKY
jgi:hypothetical protein